MTLIKQCIFIDVLFVTGMCHNQFAVSASTNITRISCASNEYTCHCGTTSPPRCMNACIPLHKYGDRFLDCPDKSDEVHFFKTVSCNGCNVTIRRLPSIRECNELGPLLCDNSTCYKATTFRCAHSNCDDTEVICTSHCNVNESSRCKLGMQCADGELILASQFCDFFEDCGDDSDENVFIGFQCSGVREVCNLPQINLFDDAAHCKNGSDLRFKNNSSWFECFDNLLVISSAQVCDNDIDCYDRSDERICEGKERFNSSLFHSELINGDFILSAFWIIGVIVILGNSVVVITIIKFLRTIEITASLKLQYLIILNIACADFIMGIYLLTIAAHGVYYSGSFVGDIQWEWKTSLRCSIIGSLAIISSEASCFLMVILTSFRLYKVCKPVASLTSSTLSWKLSLSAAWLMAVTIATIPIILQTLHYLGGFYYISNWYYPRKILFTRLKLANVAIRFAILSNQTIYIDPDDFTSIQNFFDTNFPNGIVGEQSYYGGTNICIPAFFEFFVPFPIALKYTTVIITINFVAFTWIAIAYISIYVKSTCATKVLRRRNPSRREKRMQKRIARIILTDFCCWIPVCVFFYVNLNDRFLVPRLFVERGIDPELLHQIAATFLLPINSALNPFLFSSIIDKLWKKIRCCKKNN